MLKTQQWSAPWGGRELTIEVGRFGIQANGACTVRYGDTVILATAVKSGSVREGIDYFPLMVDFEEKLYAAGKIKGSRFIKREGRPTDEAILAGRMIDRAIRPLFDERVRNDVQVIVTALSVDMENDAAIMGLLAASCALSISSIPWNGPIAAARIGQNKKTGEFLFNVTATQLAAEETGGLDLVIAGTSDRLVMVEAGAKEVDEKTVLAAMRWGLDQLQPALDLIATVVKEIGAPKEQVLSADEERIEQDAKDLVYTLADAMIFDSPKAGRKERQAMMDNIKASVKQSLIEKGHPEEALSAGLKKIKDFISNVVSDRILEKGQRVDGRSLEDIRPLDCAIDLLPSRVHGSAMFLRGDTHVLSLTTLGAPGDVQTLDTMEEEGTKRYMHHYNDTPFAYGEVGVMRGPGRRAIGHGALAERALEPVLPSQESFPYAIRVVSEVMSSNGSSSMASTCGSTLSLMAAGVPITTPVAGIAMGLASRSDAKGAITAWKVLTDLQDVEDGQGGMDFKIAGTKTGITAIQMDTKTHGLSWDIVEQTVKQAKSARDTILKRMTETIAEPRADMSPFAPRIETILIDPEKIRDVVGPGGKVINKIIAETGVDIDIEQDGRVMVTSNNGEGMRKAVEMIKALTKEIEPGEIYDGKVVRIEDFGAFVSLTPNKDGLVHVSEIAWTHVNKPSDVLKLNDTVKVQVKEIDNLGRVNLTMRGLLPKPEGWVPPPPRPPRPDRNGGGRRPSFGRR